MMKEKANRGEKMKEYDCGSVYFKYEVSKKPDPSVFTMHIHDRCEIFYLVRGNIEYLVEGSRYPLCENSVMIMRPSEAHTPKILSDACYERYAVNFPLSLLMSIDPEGRLTKAFTERALGKNNFYSEDEIDMPLFLRLLEHMRDVSDDEYEKKLTATTHIVAMLDMLSRAAINKKKPKASSLSLSERIILYIDKHLCDEISIPQLSEHFHLSVSQFSRVFKQATGAAPWDYITRKRLTLAKEKILSGYSAKAACEESGFNDYSSFYRAYTKHFGCSPQQSK